MNGCWHGGSAQACEQRFVWLSRFKHIVAYMNKARFNFFLWQMMSLVNEKMARTLPALPSGRTPPQFISYDALVRNVHTPSPSAPFRVALVRGRLIADRRSCCAHAGARSRVACAEPSRAGAGVASTGIGYYADLAARPLPTRSYRLRS